ncbi:acyl-phosphate glycerol 3-phosphate acyltransferase [Photobacterium aquae]|uniref:Acyl-phosphate glycerol 3-phosphate acyltransferase n=1 Tax=Photobacterium aquae TaxID=1195763 RepID=A0A0J1H128_9GAMM|nr:AMP-binding protein [Photobacterium aquae]KLV05550.1 acyl-phosphate glycerol 3-phosphate acyltransferase [Photobacterium aquae]
MDNSPAQTAEQLLRLITTLIAEMDSGSSTKSPPRVTLDSQLDQDLGFDSLARAELIQRTEHDFNVSLPPQTLANINTPGDLLDAILVAQKAPVTKTANLESVSLTATSESPDEVTTLQELLEWHAKQHPERPHLHVYQDADTIETISYRELYHNALRYAQGLHAKGIEPGDTVAIMLPTCNAYFYSFFGILLARAIPVPIYPPARPSQIEDHLQRHSKILQNAQSKLLITIAEAKNISRLLRMQVPSIQTIVTPNELLLGQTTDTLPLLPTNGQAKPHEIAFLQYTSGSTGIPKGVTLTHANLLANIRAMGKAVNASSSDVFVSWLPVYHDMGLIGAWLGSLYHAMPLVIMSPLLFLSQPKRWLWALHHHKATLTAAPNFAYEFCINKVPDNELEGLDLRTLRHCWNGAEPVSPTTIQAFSTKFAAYGLAAEAMTPVYGLAESSVGLTFPNRVRQPRIEWIDRQVLMRTGTAQASDTLPITNSPNAEQQALIGLGHPLPGHQIRIVDNAGRELPDRQEGDVEFKGPSSTSGYYRAPEKTAALYHGEWLITGDRGLIIDGELFLTGRNKDIIIKAGRNIYPQELEAAVNKLDGVRKGCVAAFAYQDNKTATEQLVVVAESSLCAKGITAESEQINTLRAAIQSRSLELLGVPVDDVVICPPHTVPKTSSGKIRRSACRELYQNDALDTPQRAVWLQTIRLLGSGLRPTLNKFGRIAREWIFACYMWSIMALLAPLVWLLVAVLPSRQACWAVTRWGARTLIALTRTPLTVHGIEHIKPADPPKILVANHASYLDGLVLLASSGIAHQFVAKAELLHNPLARIFLKKIGTQFVERFDTQKSLEASEQLAKHASKTDPLTLFPEGTLYRMAGIHDFHLGAFHIAAQKNIAVIPVTIKGTRSMLRDKSLFPRRGSLSVTFNPPLTPQGNDWQAAIALRNKARSHILAQSGEPDLLGEKSR